MIDLALARPHDAVRATTFRKAWASASRPVLVVCDDLQEYVIKGSQAGRMIFNDHVTAWLGSALGAPVGKPRFVDVPAELIALEPQMAHLAAGVAHGTVWVPDYTEAESVQHADAPDNRVRFAALAVLYGWMQAGNHQFIYKKTPPNLVVSVDHGHFLPGGPDWTLASLAGAPPPQVDEVLEAACHFVPAELEGPGRALRSLSDARIAAIVGRPPPTWNVTEGERIALAAYLADRRDRLVDTLHGLGVL